MRYALHLSSSPSSIKSSDIWYIIPFILFFPDNQIIAFRNHPFDFLIRDAPIQNNGVPMFFILMIPPAARTDKYSSKGHATVAQPLRSPIYDRFSRKSTQMPFCSSGTAEALSYHHGKAHPHIHPGKSAQSSELPSALSSRTTYCQNYSIIHTTLQFIILYSHHTLSIPADSHLPRISYNQERIKNSSQDLSTYTPPVEEPHRNHAG